MAFPEDTTYGGHFLEDGYNGVFFSNVSNGFARNLRVQNAGKPVFLVGACSTPEA